MRSLLTSTLVLSLVMPALAAPTCETLQGETVRCGTAGAMPVGWVASVQQREQLPPASVGESELIELLEALCVLGVFFGLLALMPEFDGTRPEDWDRQEDQSRFRR